MNGWFVIGTDTGVGKTFVAALLARQLVEQGRRVGVYKPVASGCYWLSERWTSDDADTLWRAAGQFGDRDRVCPQRFAASLAPPVAAQLAGTTVDDRLLRSGLDYWRERCETLIVEGAGGWFSPVSERSTVADLAVDFKLPLVIVARNALGTLNHTLLTLHAARTYRGGVDVAAVILNQADLEHDESVTTNAAELRRRTDVKVIELPYGATTLDTAWMD